MDIEAVYSLHSLPPLLSDIHAALISVNMLCVQSARLLLRKRNISNKSVKIIHPYFNFKLLVSILPTI